MIWSKVNKMGTKLDLGAVHFKCAPPKNCRQFCRELLSPKPRAFVPTKIKIRGGIVHIRLQWWWWWWNIFYATSSHSLPHCLCARNTTSCREEVFIWPRVSKSKQPFWLNLAIFQPFPARGYWLKSTKQLRLVVIIEVTVPAFSK